MNPKIKSKIRVLIVDDSASMRLFLEQIFSADPDLDVAGTAVNGVEAIEAVKRLSPDVVTMDILMPRMNGHDATRSIMETHPVPIVILSGNLDADEILSSCRALEAGALVALPKPRGATHPEHGSDVSTLIRTIKLMAEIRVVKRHPKYGKRLSPPVSQPPVKQGQSNLKVVAIGASTGGTVALNTILSGLPPDFPLPVLIVQHMAKGFIGGFAEWLGFSSRLPVHVASPGEAMQPGHAYIAPDGFHMLTEIEGRIALSPGAPENMQRPSISTLFRSIADVYGSNAVGILLTGMGCDGALELKLMKDKGAVTIAQDRESSIVFGMPGEAVKLGGATFVLPPDKIAAYLVSIS